MLRYIFSVLALSISFNAAAVTLSGEIRGQLEKTTDSGKHVFSMDKTRVTISDTETLDNGAVITGGVHVIAAASASASAFIRVDSSYGTVRLGSEQGLDRVWGQGATIRFSDPGIGMFGLQTRSIAFTSTETNGFAYGAGLDQVTDHDGEVLSGKSIGARYKSGPFNLYGIHHKNDSGKFNAIVGVYQEGSFRVAADHIERAGLHTSNTFSVMYNNVYVEHRRDDYKGQAPNKNETAIGYRYELSKRTSVITEASKGKVYLALSSRF